MYRPSRKKALIAQINVVPYIDVMLVLLVIFMITAPLTLQGIKVNLPHADTQPIKLYTSQPFVITVNQQGHYSLTVSKESYTDISLAFISKRAAKAKAVNPNLEVFIRGDKQVKYARIIQLMSKLQALDITKIGLVTTGSNTDL